MLKPSPFVQNNSTTYFSKSTFELYLLQIHSPQSARFCSFAVPQYKQFLLNHMQMLMLKFREGTNIYRQRSIKVRFNAHNHEINILMRIVDRLAVSQF